MKAANLIEVLIAAHNSAAVDAKDFPERGGIMLLADPGNLKSTIISCALEPYVPQATISSDINVETLNRMRPQMANKNIRTLALPAFEKLYERNPQTASNVEGHIKALVDEGYSKPSFVDQNMLGQTKARCLVIGGLVTVCYERQFKKWQDSGFNRRFIFSSFRLADPEVIIRAIDDWKRLEFDVLQPMAPPEIKMTLTPEESELCKKMLRYQYVNATPYALLKKIYAVLKWKYNMQRRSNGKAKDVMMDFATSLTTKSTELTI